MFNGAMGRYAAQLAIAQAEVERPNDSQQHPIWYLMDRGWLKTRYTPTQAAAFTRAVAARYQVQHGHAPERRTTHPDGELPKGVTLDFYEGYEDYRLIASVYREEMQAIVEQHPAKGLK